MGLDMLPALAIGLNFRGTSSQAAGGALLTGPTESPAHPANEAIATETIRKTEVRIRRTIYS